MRFKIALKWRSNHQATAKISGYNQRYRENRTKNTRPSGSWRVWYAAWCVISDRSLDLMIWSNPAFQLGLPPSRACDHRFPVGAHPTSSPGLFPKKIGGGEPWRRALCPCRWLCRWTPICMAAAGTKLEKHLSLTLLRNREFISQGLRNIRAIGFLRQWPFR